MEQKDCYIVCRGKNSKLRTQFAPTLDSRGCEIAVVGLSTYYSYPNVNETNNVMWIAGPHHKDKIEFPKGCYEVSDISEVIRKKYGWFKDDKKDESKIIFAADPITLRSHLTIKDTGVGDLRWWVIFPVKNSIGPLLGFDKEDWEFVGPGEWTSPNIANIQSVNNILVQCDIISGSSINGRPAPVIFNYSPNVAAGNKIVAEPVVPIYLPVTVDHIHELNVWVTDQDNELLDLQGEDLVVTFHMRAR